MTFISWFSGSRKDCILLTAVDCIFIILFLESCIQSGLIRSNSGYDRLFEAALLEAQITDASGTPCYISAQAQKLDAETKNLMQVPLTQGLVFRNKKLNCADISNGKIVWWENVEEILKYTHKLKDIQDKLAEEHDRLSAELALREDQLRINEKNRLYDRISQEVSRQLNQLEILLGSEQITGDNRIARVCVLSAYIKRRSNLCLLSENTDRINSQELEFCILESLENLRLCGISPNGKMEAVWWHIFAGAGRRYLLADS